MGNFIVFLKEKIFVPFFIFLLTITIAIFSLYLVSIIAAPLCVSFILLPGLFLGFIIFLMLFY